MRVSFFALILFLLIENGESFGQREQLIYHPIQTDNEGNIIPWYDADPGTSYDHVIKIVWNAVHLTMY